MTAHTVTAFAENSVHDRIYQCGVRTTIGPHHPRLAYPTAPAFYPVPVRPLRSLPPASSPPRLTATQLPLASDSGRHGSQRTSTSNISAMPGAPHQIGSLREPDLARSALHAASMVLRPRSDAACRKQIAANRLHNIPEWVRSALKLAEQALEVVQFDLGAMPFAATPAKFVQYFASSLPQCLVGQLYFVTRAKVATTSALRSQERRAGRA